MLDTQGLNWQAAQRLMPDDSPSAQTKTNDRGRGQLGFPESNQSYGTPMAQDLFNLPGPKGNPLVGSLLEMGAGPLGILTECARDYGELVPMQLGLTPVCLVNQPDLIEAVLRDRDTFIKSRGFRMLKTLLGREVAKDTTLGDYQLPQGMVLLLSQWVMHRSPEYFDQANQFLPERWNNELEKSLPRGVYFPFGDGPRICIGKGFAQMEAVLLLTTIAQQFQVQVMPGFNIVPQPSITLRPETGIQVTLRQLALAGKNT